MSAGLGLTLPMAERLLGRSNDGILAFDRNCQYIYWNPAMERLSGMRAADVLGQQAFDLFPFLTETGENQFFHRALAGEEVAVYNRSFFIPGTKRRGLFDGSYGPLYGEDGAIIGGIGIIRDVTEQRRAAELLSETEQRFRTMADVAPVLLWMADPDGLCTFFNQTWLSFTGRTLEEEWGVGWAEGVHFEDFQRCMDIYNQSFGQRRVFEMEYRLRRADGEYRWILDRGSPRYTPDGTFAGYIGSCIDITERKALEDKLRDAVQARDEFLSIASHELKTPLTSLQLQIDSLERQLQLRPEEALRSGRLASGAKSVSDQADRLAKLIEVLLDVSRINAGRLTFECSDVDLVPLVRDTADRWRPDAAQAGSELTVNVEGDCGSDPLVVYWDRLRLEQVLSNLISNAIKYGQGKPIAVTLARADGGARLQVSDQGMGISPGDQARIFERFERAAASRNFGGLGLGLWINKRLVEGMGGSISLDSVPAKGSTFTVELGRS
jgi:PAS domain S-box-containing protein